MPEAFAVLLVFAVSAAVYVAAWLSTRGSLSAHTVADLARLQQHEAWLRERLHRAEREQWGDEMIAGIAAELRAASRELDRVRVRVR